MSNPTTTTDGVIVVYRRPTPDGQVIYLAQGFEQADAERWTPNPSRAATFASALAAWAAAAMVDGLAGTVIVPRCG